MIRRNAALSLTLAALALGAYVRLSAHSIDFLGMNFSPSASAVGGSGNWSLVNAIAPGEAVTFQLQLGINTQGNTATYPTQSISFVASTVTKPAGASDVTVSGLLSHVFQDSSSTFTDTITFIAPTTPGPYSVRINTASGTGGGTGLSSGNGIRISFTVATSTPNCNPVVPTVTVTSACAVLHQTTPVTLSATVAGIGAGQMLDFYVDATLVGTGATDSTGRATYDYVPSTLSVGDHEITVYFHGDDCATSDSVGTGTLGITYLFQGFQQPINADGSSQFGGRTIPVKIKISDAQGAPITDAEPRLYFAFGTPTVIGTDAEPVANTNGDSGNLMRYDASANQYIFNWDIAGLSNGTYTIRVGLGDAECADPHTVVVSLKKKGSK